MLVSVTISKRSDEFGEDPTSMQKESSFRALESRSQESKRPKLAAAGRHAVRSHHSTWMPARRRPQATGYGERKAL